MESDWTRGKGLIEPQLLEVSQKNEIFKKKEEGKGHLYKVDTICIIIYCIFYSTKMIIGIFTFVLGSIFLK